MMLEMFWDLPEDFVTFLIMSCDIYWLTVLEWLLLIGIPIFCKIKFGRFFLRPGFSVLYVLLALYYAFVVCYNLGLFGVLGMFVLGGFTLHLATLLCIVQLVCFVKRSIKEKK